MRLIKNIKLYIALAFFGLFLPVGCISEVIVPDAGENTITVTINVPVSRAIGSADDLVVNRIDVLIFNAGGAYLGRVSPTFINGTGATRNFTVMVPDGNLDLVILANSRDRIDAISASLVVGSTTRAIAYTLLTESLPANNIWNALPGSSGYRHIPMWGEALNINAAITPTVSVELIRALAKINVRFLNQTVSDRLTITGVSLHNFHTNGYLASPNWDWTNPNASTPSPTNIANKRTGFANGVTFPASVIVNNEIVDQIFLFEVAPPANPSNPTAADRVASTALIIRGYFDGSTTPSYYRIDLRDDTGVFLGVTRNHHYEIIINSVTGPGANTGAIAYDSELVNITATVRAWDAGSQVEVNYGQYLMRTNASRFTFLSAGNPAQSLNIFSDHPGGWVIEPDYPSWINLSITSSSNITDNIVITAEQLPDDNSRIGEFFIRTDGLRKRITVGQVPLSQPDPVTPRNFCPGVALSITLAAATLPPGTTPNTITYRWERSTDNAIWTSAPTPNTNLNYTIAANTTLSATTYFRRIAIWNGFEIASAPVQVLTIPLRDDIPASIVINGVTWSTLNVNAPRTFVAHSSHVGMLYQFNRNIGWNTAGGPQTWNTGTQAWQNTAWNTVVPTGNEWTAANDPCPVGWRVPTIANLNLLRDAVSQWLTVDQAFQLGFGCRGGMLFGPGVDQVVGIDNTLIIENFNPTTMLFLPSGGARSGTLGQNNISTAGVYWSRNQQAVTTAQRLQFGATTNPGTANNPRIDAMQIRCTFGN